MKFLIAFTVFVSVVRGQDVDGGWGPWQADPEIDCCMYGGYERVYRYCNNPTPEGGGSRCIGLDSNPKDSEHKWMTCECKCVPECDPTPLANVKRTAFCANDTGKPAHCVCNHGLVPVPNRNPGDIFICQNVTGQAAVEAAAAAVNVDEPMDPDVKDALKLAQIVIIVWLLAWIAAVMVLFFIMCYFKTDRIIQLQEEITLILVYILIIFATERPSDEMPCKLVSILLHYLFTCTIVFFCLEALHTYSIVTYMVPKRGYLHALANLGIGYGLPLIPLACSVGIRYDDYGTNIYHCWCQLDAPHAWGVLFPLGFLAFVCTVIAEAQGQGKYKALPDTDHGEFTSAKVSQGSIMIIMPLCLLSYVFGLVAIDLQSKVMWSLFLVVTIFLGPVIFFFHCIGNAKIRALLARMCPCFPCLREHEPERPMSARVGPAEDNPAENGSSGSLPENGRDPESDLTPRHRAPSARPPGPDPGPDTKDTDWKNFYKWVSDGKKDNVSQAENVLFEPS